MSHGMHEVMFASNFDLVWIIDLSSGKCKKGSGMGEDFLLSRLIGIEWMEILG